MAPGGNKAKARQPEGRRGSSLSTAQSESNSTKRLQSLQPGTRDSGAALPSAPLSPATLRAIQRAAGNRAVCQVIKVQRLQHPDFPKDVGEMSDLELLKANRFAHERHFFGKSFSPEDRKAVFSEMRARDLDDNSLSDERNDPMARHREFMPTRKDVGVEVAKPTFAVGSAGGGYLAAKDQPTAPGAVGGSAYHASTGGAVGSEIFGGLLLADSALGVWNGLSARQEAQERGDTAGVRLGTRKAKSQGWGVAGGATGVAGGGIKLGAALGSTAVGLASAAGGLGVAGGALTVAQGSWKIYLAGKKLSGLSTVSPMTKKGKEWKTYAEGREKRKVGINALKVAAGALGIAAGALLIVSNPAGWAVGIAALAVGGALAVGKLSNKIGDAWNRRNAKKKMEKSGELDSLAKGQTPEQEVADPARRKEVHQLANKVAQENSQNARYAAAMIAALQKGKEPSLDWLVSFRDRYFPDDKDFTQTRAALGSIKGRRREQMQLLNLSDDDFERHDAQLILEVLNVDGEAALSESGQDLIQKKLSVAEAT